MSVEGLVTMSGKGEEEEEQGREWRDAKSISKATRYEKKRMGKSSGAHGKSP